MSFLPQMRCRRVAVETAGVVGGRDIADRADAG
jgi:hypothetical protein